MQDDEDAKLIVELMRNSVPLPENRPEPPPPSQPQPAYQAQEGPPCSTTTFHSNILVLGSNNYVAGGNLIDKGVQPAVALKNQFLEHLAFQKAAKIKCSVIERSQLELLVNEHRFVPDKLIAAMRRGGLRWSEEQGHLAPETATLSIALISFVFLVLLILFGFFLIVWTPSHATMHPVKFYGVGVLYFCGFAGFMCGIWHWSVVPLKTAFLAAKILKENSGPNR